jgi:hypothetical protein
MTRFPAKDAWDEHFTEFQRLSNEDRNSSVTQT